MSPNLVAIDGTLDVVDALRISVLEKGRRARREEWRMNRKDSVREGIPCGNPLCVGGGMSLGELLRDLVRSQQAEFIGTSFCSGQEGDPETDPPPLPSCQTRFEVQINLHFR